MEIEMNYEQMSDFEINKAYLNQKYKNTSCLIYQLNLGCPAAVVYLQRCDKEMVAEDVFDFNNPADACPIIFENKISIIWNDDYKKYHVGSSFVDLAGCEGGGYSFNGKSILHDNPLRAAMIVFLMMQEKAK